MRAALQQVRSLLWAVRVAVLSLVTSSLTVWALAPLVIGGSAARVLLLAAWLGFLAAVIRRAR